MMRNRSVAGLGTTTVGNRSPTLTHLTIQEIDGYQMDLVVRAVERRLHDRSAVFSDSDGETGTTTTQLQLHQDRRLPHFVPEELGLGKELGRGEFGIVYQVDALDPTECDCSRCLFERAYNNDNDRGEPSSRRDGNREEDVPQIGSRRSAGSIAEHESKDVKNLPPNGGGGGDVVDDDGDDDDDNDGDNESDEDDDALSAISDGSLIRPTAGGEARSRRTMGETVDTHRKCYMQRRCIREGRPRYAVKRLREDFDEGKKRLNAAIDLAVEAKFLAALPHPNIVRIRGTVDNPGHRNYMILMDCLTMTLREKIEAWSGRETKVRHSPGFVLKRLVGPLFQPNRGSAADRGGQGDQDLTDLCTERLMATHDLARGMKFLHSKRILFRDLKPENIGFDVRARVKLFDFGLAKELKEGDLVDPPDGYRATGLTGSRRYMAPEVALCKYYGLSADVYSYGIILWEAFSGRTAYEAMNFDRHFDQVVLRGKRPNIKVVPGLPKAVAVLMRQTWEPDPGRRVDFEYVCNLLKHESKLLSCDHVPNGHQHHLTDRTAYLMGQSARSHSDKSSRS